MVGVSDHSAGGKDRLPEGEGGTVIDGERLPSMDLITPKERGDDPVQEAINRAEYFDHNAVGDVRGYTVQVTARVTKSMVGGGGFNPVLTIHVGGEWDAETATYLTGSAWKLRETFDSVWALNDRFGKLCREHGLVIIPPGYEPETNDIENTATNRPDPEEGDRR